MQHNRAIDKAGGKRPFAASDTNDRNAQIVNFAKLGPVPDTGPSCKARRIRALSPKCGMLRSQPMAAFALDKKEIVAPSGGEIGLQMP